MTIIPITAY